VLENGCVNPSAEPDEELLTGGNVSGAVFRVGAAVAKPVTATTAGVEALLGHLTEVGYLGAPRPLGRDDAGRYLVEYIPGELAMGTAPFTLTELNRVGRLIRHLHDAAESFVPPPDAHWDVVIRPDRDDLICHHDLAPWNLVRDGERWVFIDWDGAGPGSRLWDLGYAAHGFVSIGPDGDPAEQGPRLRALVDGYGLDQQQRRELPVLMAAHIRGMAELLRESSLTGVQPWSRLYAEGHGDYWRRAAEHAERHLDVWTAALLD
jgi:Ser/Thr protein kinase RdoA (MazF antagonist)